MLMSQSLHFLRAFQLSRIYFSLGGGSGSRNPFIFLGHFNSMWKRKRENSMKSQSLHFLRAFQLEQEGVGNPFRALRRNPFIFLGHFNTDLTLYGLGQKLSESQSLHFLRAFQHLTATPDGVAVTVQSQSLHFLRAFQHIWLLMKLRTVRSQSLHFLRAFQHR